MSDFHLQRLNEPSSWTAIGGFLLGVSHVTSGAVSVVALTLSSCAFGAGYLIKEKAAGVAALSTDLIKFFQERQASPAVPAIAPIINAPSPVTAPYTATS